MKSKRCLFVNGSMHGVLRQVDISDGYTDYIVPTVPEIPITSFDPNDVPEWLHEPIPYDYEVYEPHTAWVNNTRHTFYILKHTFHNQREKVAYIQDAILKHWSDTFADA